MKEGRKKERNKVVKEFDEGKGEGREEKIKVQEADETRKRNSR